MVLEAIIISILIRGYKEKSFKFLNDLNLKNLWIVIIALISKYFFPRLISLEILYKYYYIFDVSILLLFCVFFYLNGSYLKLSAIGVFLNGLVVLLNKKMPVSIKLSHLVMNEDKFNLLKNGYSFSHGFINNAKLYFLSDIIPIPKPFIYPRLISIGDIFLSIGVFMYILKTKEES